MGAILVIGAKRGGIEKLRTDAGLAGETVCRPNLPLALGTIIVLTGELRETALRQVGGLTHFLPIISGALAVT